MKISDQVMRYPSLHRGSHDGICRVRVFHALPGGITAVVTNLRSKNTGSSVTNTIENVYAAMKKSGIIIGDAQLVEQDEDGFAGNSFDLVTFSESGNPSWQPLDIVAVAEITGASVVEFQSATLSDTRLINEIDRLRNAINPFADFPEVEPAEIIRRREDIRDGMISRGEIRELVTSGAGERDLLNLLKQDLSVFGEVYAQPADEYICFSEFPVADGFVDFVVFTGHSVMDIVFIEIKGADFGLLTRGKSSKITDHISFAAQQVRTRVGHVYRQYEDFRTSVHQLRAEVENGKMRHRSLVGPYTPLGVDRDKDVQVRGVVIGGRTERDLEESRIRHDFEQQAHPPVKLESWDTWLRKLRRE